MNWKPRIKLHNNLWIVSAKGARWITMTLQDKDRLSAANHYCFWKNHYESR